MKIICKTERLCLRELTVEDADFVNELLNTPKFLKFIGDRNVRSTQDAADFIEGRYRKSYEDHGFGLWAVETHDGKAIGMCGFVKRESLPLPDIGFAFLPAYERLGYGMESARAAMDHGRTQLGFTSLNAITSLDNHASGKLLGKLGFIHTEIIDSPDGERLKLFEYNF